MTQRSSEIQRLERDLNERPELKEKLDAEFKRIAEAKEAKNDGEAMVKAAASLGYTITVEELDRAAADLEKLDDDELEAAGGDKMMDEEGRDGTCTLSWHCFTVLKHTEVKATNVACWEDYTCAAVYKDDMLTKVVKGIKDEIMKQK